MPSDISEPYDAELANLRATFMTMGGMVEEQIRRSMHAFLNNDSDTAHQVHEVEKRINQYELKLDRETTSAIARRNPAARELRLLVGILKNITDLERIGDEANRIAKFSERFGVYDQTNVVHQYVTRLFERTMDNLRSSLDAYGRQNVEQALKTIKDDREIDDLYYKTLDTVMHEISSQNLRVEDGLSIIFAARSLERIGDHSKNISENVYYLVNGDILNHNPQLRTDHTS